MFTGVTWAKNLMSACLIPVCFRVVFFLFRVLQVQIFCFGKENLCITVGLCRIVGVNYQFYWNLQIIQVYSFSLRDSLCSTPRLTFMLLYAFQIMLACLFVLSLATYNYYVLAGLVMGHTFGHFFFSGAPSDYDSLTYFL